MYEQVIITSRLELHHIPAAGLIALLEEKSDLEAIAGRNFTNPHRVLIDDSGPLGWRVPQVKADPSTNKWFVRFITLKDTGEIIGSTSFHGVPDSEGMMEIGIGIDEKHIDQVFVIFKRLNNDSLYKGYGIGLAHCKKIVGIHNGEISVKSKLGSGSTFSFTISKKI